ncbi:MAG: flagellar biosynthetic protein FliO [Gammaproteobacteria bacterium]|nr:MAG: flagellar biosynthetic protein FliO [Gammaproteobacteria bacterium]
MMNRKIKRLEKILCIIRVTMVLGLSGFVAVAEAAVEKTGIKDVTSVTGKAAKKIGSNVPSSLGAQSLLQMILGLAFVVGLVLLLAWFSRRFGKKQLTGGLQMNILGSLNLGSREKIALVEVGDKQILIGITPAGISNLHTFDEPVIDTSKAENIAPNQFSQILGQVLQRGK